MLSAVFVDRPRLAIVIAIVTTIAGTARRCWSIPIAQYPDIVPPQVSVTTFYPGRLGGGGRSDRRAADRERRSSASTR